MKAQPLTINLVVMAVEVRPRHMRLVATSTPPDPRRQASQVVSRNTPTPTWVTLPIRRRTIHKTTPGIHQMCTLTRDRVPAVSSGRLTPMTLNM